MNPPKIILPIIVISQFCCTSFWFAGNSVMNNLLIDFNLSSSALGHLTSSVQFGFITGTLVFSILTIADRFSPSKVFFICAILGAIFNAGLIWEGNNFISLFSLRFLTGFFLSGIYPIGMKITTDYYDKGLGISLGLLVGASVLGTAFPHLLKGLSASFPWNSVVLCTSVLAILGGFLMFTLVPDGSYRKQSMSLDLSACFNLFKNKNFRTAAFGYFGHLWELYAFWTFLPIIIVTYTNIHSLTDINTSLLSAIVIGIGGFACVASGFLAQSFGTKKVAFSALLLSCSCCLLSPFIFSINNEYLFFAFLLFWGIVVIADSPLFSTLVAQNTQAERKGTALTIVNCIGFSITIVSIQLLNIMLDMTNSNSIYAILAIGPILGLIALSRNNIKV